MDTENFIHYEWPYVVACFRPVIDLESTAKEHGALLRKRGIANAEALLRLALAYGFCGLSLRQTAAWAEVSEVASISDVALMKRLRMAAPWLSHLVAVKLAERAPPPPGDGIPFHLRLVDATTVSQPGSTGTDWRLHVGLDLCALAIDHLQLTDATGGETLSRFDFKPGELVIGDRGYAHRRGLHWVVDSGADFVVRLNWQNVPLRHRDNTSFDMLTALRSLPESLPGEFPVQTARSRRDKIPPVRARLVAVRKTEAAAAVAREKVLRERARKGRGIDPRTLEAAGYVFVLTSVPEDVLTAEQILDLYRFRWQIEIVFKRLKGLTDLGALPAKDPDLARSFIYAKILAALILQDLTQRYLDFSPWGYPLS